MYLNTSCCFVLAKPSKPKGPLEVSKVTANGCKLEWKQPDDDGGAPIDHYVVERMDVESGRWVPCAESKTPEAEVSKYLKLSETIKILKPVRLSTSYS